MIYYHGRWTNIAARWWVSGVTLRLLVIARYRRRFLQCNWWILFCHNEQIYKWTGQQGRNSVLFLRIVLGKSWRARYRYVIESYLVWVTNIVLGLFFVIEGFLDIVLPAEKRSPPEKEPTVKPPMSSVDSLYDVDTASSNGDSNISSISSPKESPKPSALSASHPDSSMRGQRPLFIVKPGGIAGYLGDIIPLE